MAQTRVLLGRVGGGSAIPPLAPEILLEANGQGSTATVAREFNLFLDFDDARSAVYRLASTDWYKIYYSINLRLTNVAPGKSKILFLDIKGLNDGQLCAALDPSGYWRDQHAPRTFSRAVGIYENDIRTIEWRGQDNLNRTMYTFGQTVYQAHQAYRWSLRSVGPTPVDNAAIWQPAYYTHRQPPPRNWGTSTFSNITTWSGNQRARPVGGQYPWGPFAPLAPNPGGGAILRRLSLYSSMHWKIIWESAADRQAGVRNASQTYRTYRFKFECYGDGARLLTVDAFHPMGYADT